MALILYARIRLGESFPKVLVISRTWSANLVDLRSFSMIPETQSFATALETALFFSNMMRRIELTIWPHKSCVTCIDRSKKTYYIVTNSMSGSWMASRLPARIAFSRTP